jgi:hypothetical protein
MTAWRRQLLLKMRQGTRSRDVRMRSIRFAGADRRFDGMRLSGVVERIWPTHNHIVPFLASSDSLGSRQRFAAKDVAGAILRTDGLVDCRTSESRR